MSVNQSSLFWERSFNAGKQINTGDNKYSCLQVPLTAGRPGREEVRDSPGLWRLSWERMGESILDEPANVKIKHSFMIKNRPKGQSLGINMSEQRLTQDAMPLKWSSLREIGYDAHAVPSLPTIIAAEIWITTIKAHSKNTMFYESCLNCLKRLWYFQHVRGSTLLLLDAWSPRKGWCWELWQ